jgi:kynureninase
MSEPGMAFEASEAFARRMDAEDPLRRFRDEFLFPLDARGEPVAYLAGNSLGLQPRKARRYVEQELDDWARYAVDGHLKARHPWLPYHEELTAQAARLVGAKPIEVVAMNSLTVNLHLMMVSFYRPTRERFKILIEGGAFPSDRYAVASQARFHGLAPKQTIVEVIPRAGEAVIREEDLHAAIAREGSSLALVLLGNVNYLSGQAFDVRDVTQAAHAVGAMVGFDLAHGAGNLLLDLHDAGPDFAVWCCYKYLNGGPGTVAGCFVHERHAHAPDLPRFEGWWGHDKATRFQMPHAFDSLPGVEAWQLSNPPIFQLAALRASLELFDAATMGALREKSVRLTAYLELLLRRLPAGQCRILTPSEASRRGAQLSLKIGSALGSPRDVLSRLAEAGVVCDLREPDVIRAAPAPLYCGFLDVFRFATVLQSHAGI